MRALAWKMALPSRARLVVAAIWPVCLASCGWLASTRHDDYIGPAAAAESRTRGVPTSRPARPPTTRPAGPLALTVHETVLLALENNQALRVERLTPPIRRTVETQERAVFDPVVSAGVAYDRERADRGGTAGSSRSEAVRGDVSVDTLLPTGTAVTVEADGTNADNAPGADTGTARLGLTVTQALLEGLGPAVNLASLRQARLDTLSSQYELRGFAEALVAEIESTYWDYVLAQRQIEIYTESLTLARKQLSEADERIKVGKLAETERAAAEAEVALRREALINVRSSLAITRLRLLRLINPQGGNLWARQITLDDHPTAPAEQLDSVEDHARLALRMRPDLNQARLAVQRDDLELVKTRQGLLPKLDLFITLGKTGYAESFGRAVADLDGAGYDIGLGLRFTETAGRRADRARHQRAVLDREQAVEAVHNLAQLVQVDVRSAHVEVNRAREQVAATAATRRLQQEKLRAETEKFRVGRSTSLLVAQAQRDLVASQISEVEAQVNYLKAFIDLYRLDGSLLQRRGIVAPGRDLVRAP